MTDCNGNNVTNLAPGVSLLKLDNSSVPVNGPAIIEVPTKGKNMRWDGWQYIYNFSTKNSQFSSPVGAPLTTGTYRLAVTDPSFGSVVVTFNLK